ncbi:MAG: protoporphyrinogen oxidase [Vulcanimicrobiota bacterium]
MQVAVIGGGISGLTAAYQLRQSGASVTLFEASPRLGGAIQTVRQHGCLMEAGPDSLLVMKPAAVQLARELGLELVPSVAEGPPGVVHKGRIQPLPDGFRMVAPTQLLPFVRTPLLSLGGKLRAGLEWLVPATRASADESVADFVTRRFGREVLDTLAQPLIGGIYAADPARLSLLATLPMFRQLEQSRGSVTAGLLAQMKKSGSSKGSMFVTPREGMQSLVQALADRLEEVRLATPVEQLTPTPTGWEVKALGKTYPFRAVVLACAAPHLARLTRFDPLLSDALGQIESTTTVTIHFLFEQCQIGRPLRGSGFVIPHVEGYHLTACTYSHLKYPGRAPEGKALLRCHVGNAMSQRAVLLEDQALCELALEELGPLLKLGGPPQQSMLVRHTQALPQYQVGHKELVAAIDRQMALHSGLALAGNGLEGVGVSDCITRARQAVEVVGV